MLQPGETYIIEPNGYDGLDTSQQVQRVIPAVFLAFLLCVI